MNRSDDRVVWSRRCWRVVNVASLILTVSIGYVESRPSHEDVRFGPVLLLVLLFTVLAFATFAIGVVQMRRESRLLRPGFDRSPFRWSDDPLESLHFATYSMAAIVVGTMIRLMVTREANVLLSTIFFSAFVGLLLGLVISYRLWHDVLIGGEDEERNTQ